MELHPAQRLICAESPTDSPKSLRAIYILVFRNLYLEDLQEKLFGFHSSQSVEF